MSLLKDLYKGLVKSANRGSSKKQTKGSNATKKKKKEKKTTPSSKGEERRNTVQTARQNNAQRATEKKAETQRKSTTTSAQPSSRSGAFRPVGKAGVMGGNTSTKKDNRPKITVNGKAIGPATKAGVMGGNKTNNKKETKGYTVNGKTLRTLTKAGVTGGGSSSYKEASKERAESRKKIESGYGKDNGPKKNALGTWSKTHTGTWGNPVGEAVTKATSHVSTRARTYTGSMAATNEQAKKDIKQYEKDTGYKLTAKEKKQVIKDYYNDNLNFLKSKEAKKEVNKEANKLAKDLGVKGGSYKAQDLTMEDYLKIQNATRVDPKTGKKMLGKELSKKVGSNTAYNATKNTASKISTGVMQGLSYGDVIHGGPGTYGKEEKKAIKELQESGAYGLGYGAGMLGSFAMSGVSGAGKSIAQIAAKGAAKGAAKATAKSAGKKFAQNRLGELVAETPLNALDAIKMSRDENGDINKKEALKWMGFNTALTGGMGGAIEGLGMKWTKRNAKKLIALQTKANKGIITDAEKETLQKLYKSLNSARKDVQAAKSNAAERGYLKAKGLKGEADDVRFAQEVDDVITGKSKEDRMLHIGDTPETLLDLGAKDLPMTMKSTTVRKMAYPQGYEDALKGVSARESIGHNLGVGTVKATRKDLANPLYVFRSNSQDNSYVVFIRKKDRNGNLIMDAVHLDKDGRVGPANEVASGYGKPEEFIKKQIAEGNLLLDNTKKGSVNGLQGNGLQLPERDDPLDPMIRLQQEKGSVKKDKVKPEKSSKISKAGGAKAKKAKTSKDKSGTIKPKTSQNPSATETRIVKKYDDAINKVDSGDVDDNILRDIEVTRSGDTWREMTTGDVLSPQQVKDRIANWRDLEAKTQARIDNDPRYAPFRELDDLEAEYKALEKEEFTPEVEKRADEITSRIDEISDELGGNVQTKRSQVLNEIRSDIWQEQYGGGKAPESVTKTDSDEALKAIEAQRASDETVVRNNEDVIKNSDDELAGPERPAPDSGEMPKGLKRNVKAARPIKDQAQKRLASDGYAFTKAEKKDIDDAVETISRRIANGDEAGAKADAEELVEKHFHFDAEEKTPNKGFKEKREELKEIQNYLKNHAWEMPTGSARSLDEFLEAIGLPKSATKKLPIRRWSKKDSTFGLKGAHKGVIDKGGKTPRVQIDDQWTELSRQYPEYFKPELQGRTEEQFRALVDAAMLRPDDVIPEFFVRQLDDAEIKEWKEAKVDEILDLARENAGTYRGVDEPRPLKPIDDLDEGQLEKLINREKIHLEKAIKKHGKDSPRVKEIEDWLSNAEKTLDEMRGETKQPIPKREKIDTDREPVGLHEVEEDVNKLHITETDAEKYTRQVKEAKKEHDEIVKKYGEDSPRAKESKAKMEDLEERLEDAKHEKETGQKTNNTGDAPPMLSGELTIDMPRTRVGKAWGIFYRKSVDSFADIEKAAKKIGGEKGQELLAQVNAVRNSKNIASTWISGKRYSWNKEATGKSLDRIFKMAGKGTKRKDFIDYCYHKHNLERIDVDKAISGMPREAEESIKAIEELEAKYASLKVKGPDGKMVPAIKAFQEEVVKYADDLLQYKVDAGIVSKEEAARLRKYKNYIPTFTAKDFKAAINEDINSGISIDRGIRRAVGGNEEDQLMDLYQQLAQSTRSTMKHTEMNEMIRMLGDLQGIKYSEIDKSLSPDDVLQGSLFTEQSNGKHFATYYDADGAHTIDISEEMFNGIREWSGEEKAALMNLFKPFNVPGQIFKNLVTGWNVIFGARNGVRDLFTALTYTKDLKGFAKAYPKAVKTVMTRKGPYWDAYIAAGGKYSSLAKSSGPGGFLDAIDSKVYSPLTWCKEINDTIETMPRMMEFISTIDKAGGINGAGREVINRAMRNANDVTLNFGRSGIVGRTMNSGFVPYLNPSIQGLDKLVRVFTEAKQEKNFRGLIGLGMKMSTFAIAPAVFNEWMLKDNEDYQQLNTRDKDSNYFIPLGPITGDKDDKGKFIKIPKARELVVVAEPAQYFFRHAQFGDSGGWKQMFQSAIDNIGVVNPLTDNLVSPLYRVATNKTWFGGDIETAYEVDNLLPQDRYDEGTTLLAIDLAQKNPAKALKLSPKKIDNLIDSYTGVIGDFFIPMNSKASKGNPFVNKFITDSVFSNKLSTEAWDTYEKLKQQSNSTTLDPKKVQDAKYKLQDFYNGYLGDTVTLNRAITDIQNNNKLSKSEKHDLVRQLKLSQNEIYRSSKDSSTPKLNGKEVDPLTAIFNLYNSRKDTKGKAVGITFKYAHKNYQESYEKYKDSEEYNKMSGTDKAKNRVKYLKYVTTIRDTRGKIGEEKDNFIDYKTVAVVGQMKNASESMVDSFGKGNQGLYKYLKENAKTYKDHKYNLNHFIETEKTVVDASRKIGVDYRSQMQNHDVSMSLAHKERDDGSYFIGDKKPEYQNTRMDPARYLVKKDSKQWSTKRIHDFADKHGYNYESDYDEVYKQAKKTYPDKSEKEWAAVAQVITGKGDNDFGDQSLKGDTGIMGTVTESEGGGGRGRRRGRGRRGGRGGGGGSGGGGTMPATATGAIKAKVTDAKVSNPFKGRASNFTSKSNLDDAYRKKVRKLRTQGRKKH